MTAPWTRFDPVPTLRARRPRLAGNLAGYAGMILSVAALFAGSTQLAAQSPDAEEARRQRDASRYQLDEAQRRAKEIQAEVARIDKEREGYNAQLIETAKKIQDGEAQLTRTEGRLGELEAQEQLIRGSLEKSHGSIASLLAAMQRMGRNPPPVFVTRREDALSMVRSAMMLASAFPQMRTQALALSEKLNSLVKVIDESRIGRETLRTESARLQENHKQLSATIDARRRSVAERQDELAQVRRAATEIAKNVTDLDDLVRRLDKAVAEKTRMGEYERQLAAAQAVKAAQAAEDAKAKVAQNTVPVSPVTPPPAAAGTAPPVAAPPQRTASLGKPAEDLRPSITIQPGERLAMATPGRIEPAIPFADAVGKLRLPAQGSLIQGWGDRGQTGRSDGIVIETRPGAQVVSPNDGWIIYAGEFRSYGQILIINAGGGYHVLLLGLSQINVQVGQFVLGGEPVGVMAASPQAVAALKSASTKTQESAPGLYVEFRKNQRPIDSGPWWAETARKVAG